MSKNILLINDLPGYGKVALAAMFPILSHMGHSVYNLPTALVSNTLDYGEFEIMDTAGYMEKTVGVWDHLGFSFDCIATGFIVSQAQVRLITDFVHRQKEKNPALLLVVDPIMGDDGALYNGVGPETVGLMRELIGLADVIVPNFTEAAFLANKYVGQKTLTQPEISDLLNTLSAMTSGATVITSLSETGTGRHGVYGRMGEETFSIPYEEIPVRFPGTGDIFSAVLTGKLLDGAALPEAVKAAMGAVEVLIRANAGNEDKYKGIPIEECLGLLGRTERNASYLQKLDRGLSQVQAGQGVARSMEQLEAMEDEG